MCFNQRLPLAASTRPLRGHLERRSLLFGNTAEVEILRRASPEELVPDRAGAAVFGSVTATGYDEVYGFRHERLHLFTPVWRRDRVGVAGYQHRRHLGAERFEIVAGQLRLRPLRQTAIWFLTRQEPKKLPRVAGSTSSGRMRLTNSLQVIE